MKDQSLISSHLPCAAKLFTAVWPSIERVHQLASLIRHNGLFANIPVKDIDSAVRLAISLSDAGIDAYFAPGEYATPGNRTSANASGACAFWMDVDVGPDKAANNKGYLTTEEARSAVIDFCKSADLPEPTHIVGSGGGLHVYWVLDAFVPRERWHESAKKLKALTHALGLRADDTRTADLASVLRVPGTKNYKYDPPKDVELLHAIDQFIQREEMFQTIDRAHYIHCVKAGESNQVAAVHPAAPATPAMTSDARGEPPNLNFLSSALKVLDPDCDEYTWKIHRIAPMANTACLWPDLAAQIYKLGRDWSSGALRGIPSEKWVTPGSSGLTGEQMFDVQWNRFLTSDYKGKRVSLGTIYYHAKEAGWSFTDWVDNRGEEAGE